MRIKLKKKKKKIKLLFLKIEETNKKKKIKKVIKTFRFWRLSIAQILIIFSSFFIVVTWGTFMPLIGIDSNDLQYSMLTQSGALIDYKYYIYKIKI